MDRMQLISILRVIATSVEEAGFCENCIRGDDPRAWCDCSTTLSDVPCKGPCSLLAHDPVACPKWHE